jgi:hypothetical protein
MASKKPAPKNKAAEPAPRPARKAKPKKLGRPPKKPSERRTTQIKLAVRAEDKALLDAGAAAAGVSLTAFLIEPALARARKLVQENV